MRTKKRPTIKDVARISGLSLCSVSHVLNHDAYAATLRQETREHILKVADEIGYVRNTLAAATRNGFTKMIAFISASRPEDPQGHFISPQNVNGILIRASESGYCVKVYSGDRLSDALADIQGSCIRYVISTLEDRKCLDELVSFCRKQRKELVLISSRHSGCRTVCSDNFQAISDAVRFLYKQGHRRIAYLCSDKEVPVNRERYNGYTRTMKELGLSIRGLTEMQPDYLKAGATFLALSPGRRPTAYIGETPGRALALESNLLRAGVRVPQDAAIIGFGDESNLLDAAYVPLTSLPEQPFEIGRTAVEMVLGEKITIPEYRTEKDFTLIPVKMTVRKSTEKTGNGEDGK